MYTADELMASVEDDMIIDKFITPDGKVVKYCPDACIWVGEDDESFHGVNWIALPIDKAKTICNFVQNLADMAVLDHAGIYNVTESIYGNAGSAIFNLRRECSGDFTIIMSDEKYCNGTKHQILPGITVDPFLSIIEIEPMYTMQVLNNEIISGKRLFAILFKDDAETLLKFLEDANFASLMTFEEKLAVRFLRAYVEGKFFEAPLSENCNKELFDSYEAAGKTNPYSYAHNNPFASSK